MGKNKVVFFIIILLASLGCTNVQHDTLQIAVAANMQYALKPIIHSFSNQTGIPCEMIVGSSGKLTAQIKAGAPYDVFISADIKYPNELLKANLTHAEMKIYAYGKLILWTMRDDIKPSFEALIDEKVNFIAMANPKIAPYGKVTKELLNQYGIYNQIKDKLVYGESVAQTNQFILSKSADIGFTAKSVVMTPNVKGKGQWIDINHTHYHAPAQGVVVLKTTDSKIKNAENFYNFMSSSNAKDILLKFGYSINEKG